jgi:hypothetical protein
MSDDRDDFLHKPDIRSYLRIPFMYKVAENHGNQGIQLKIDGGGTCECGEDFVEWFMC